MKILHLSHEELPDSRIELLAQENRRHGDVPYFIGRAISSPPSGLFEEAFILPMSRMARAGVPVATRRVNRKLKSLVDQIQPDIIHAHNVFSAKMVLEYGIPFIYDDHEYWSKKVKIKQGFYRRATLSNRLAEPFVRWLWPRWEKQVLRAAPCITVSETIAEEHRLIQPNTFTVPSFPRKEKMPIPREDRSTGEGVVGVFVGGRMVSEAPHRLVDFLDLWIEGGVGQLLIYGDEPEHPKSPWIEDRGFRPLDEVLVALGRADYGIMPWRPYWYHRYGMPNKIAIYGHAGLPIVAPDSFTNLKLFQKDKKAQIFLFSSREELRQILESFQSFTKEKWENIHAQMQEFALQKLVFDRYADQLYQAYKIALT